MQIPTIDMSSGLDHPRVIESLRKACRDWGFFHLVGHGLSSRRRRELFQEMAAFFALPKAEKLAVARTASNFWGYYDKELTKNRVDSKEIFDIDGNLDKLLQPELQHTNPHRTPWPESMPIIRSVVVRWLQQCESLSQSILEAICVSLEQSPDVLNPFFLTNHSSFLRFNYYPSTQERPPVSVGEDVAALGIHPHTDAGALTVLAQDHVPGLQVHKNATWHTVIPVQDSFIINIGDMIQVWSNDRYVAPEHRVLASAGEARYSVPFFYNPSYETICQPLLDDQQQSRYKPICWGDFRFGRAAGDYVDLGEEIQIAHYRI